MNYFQKKDYQKENENDFNHIKKDLQLLQKMIYMIMN
jgi:hypothetical protein